MIILPQSLFDNQHINLKNSSFTQIHENHSRMDPVYIKAQEKHNSVDTKPSYEINEQQIDEKTATQVDDESLPLHKPLQAVQLLEGNNHFSQDGLDRTLISACRHELEYLVQTFVCLVANVQFKDTQGNTQLLEEKADGNAFNSVDDTALILSIRAAGSLEMVRVLLEQEGIDISHQNMDGYTALMKAIEVGEVDMIKILMERYNKEETKGVSGQLSYPRYLKTINDVILQGMTAEHIADKCGLRNVYEILKTHLINSVSPLVLAVKRNDITSLQMLLGCHFIEKQDIQNALMKMFKKGDVKDIKMLTENDILIIKTLLKHEKMVDPIWDGDSSLLSVCVKTVDHNLVELLCQQLDQQQQMTSERRSQALITAAELGQCELIELLLKYNVDINNKNTYSGSPLDCALRHGHHESAKLLIQRGAKIDIRMALRSAVMGLKLENVKFLFEFCPQEAMSYRTQDKLTKLFRCAVRFGNMETIGYFLDAGADVNYDCKICWDIYREVGEHGKVMEYLTSPGASVKLQLRYVQYWFRPVTERSLRLDLWSGKEVLRKLLEKGVSVNERLKGGKTLLMAVASRGGCEYVLQLLLDQGADINAKDDNGNTALMEAVRWHNEDNAEFLIRFHQANNLGLDVQNLEGLTALMLAVKVNCPNMVEQLINCSAGVNVCDEKGNNALLHAVLNGARVGGGILEPLIIAGSDVNCQNNEGFSPLMLASQNCWIPLILLLLDSGSDVNAVSKMDSTKTVFSFVSAYLCNGREFGRCLEAFLKKGARLSDMNPSCLHIMIRNSDVDSIPVLIQGGLAPVDVETKSLNLESGDWEAIPAVSPLYVALLVRNVSLARYFVGKLFLTSSDVTSVKGNTIIYRVLDKGQSCFTSFDQFLPRELEESQRKDCLTLLDELSSQPWSLFQLAFVSVSSAVGSSPGRENRVDMLELPQVIKDKLLFKS